MYKLSCIKPFYARMNIKKPKNKTFDYAKTYGVKTIINSVKMTNNEMRNVCKFIFQSWLTSQDVPTLSSKQSITQLSKDGFLKLGRNFQLSKDGILKLGIDFLCLINMTAIIRSLPWQLTHMAIFASCRLGFFFSFHGK